MAAFVLRIEGLEQVQAAMRTVGPRARIGLRRGMRAMGERIMTQAKGMTPVDTGALRSSGHVEQASTDQGEIVTLAFGGAAAPYAEIQHERLDFRHKVGQAKYLEIPFLASITDLPATVADFVHGTVEGGGGAGAQPGGGAGE